MSVLLRPDFRKDNTVWFEIRSLDGRCLSRTHGIEPDGKWRWLTDVIKGDAECNYEDIDLEESEDGDFISVRGRRYAVVTTDFSDTPEHKQAMAEREVITATAAARQQIARLEAKVAFLEHEVDVWRERYEASDEALEQAIREAIRQWMLSEGNE